MTPRGGVGRAGRSSHRYAPRGRRRSGVDPVAVLRERFGYPGFRPGQEELVRAVLAGRDALGVLPTGGGKSVCYQVPALLLGGLTLVVSPLVSLMDDQAARALRAGIPAGRLTSQLAPEEARRTLDDAVEGRLRLLLVAPERFQVAAFRRALARVRVALLAVDEAHCISEWGHDFRPSYRELGAVRAGLGCPVLALTATATPRVRADIEGVLRLRDPLRVVGTFDRPNLSWHVVAARRGRRFAAAWPLVRDAGGPVVVYAATRREVEDVRDALARRGLAADAYHAGLRAGERARVQEAFLAGRRSVVVATNAFGMGVDKPDVRRVVHWRLPGTLESYYQEAGRAGRDGAAAACVALWAPGDLALHRDRARAAWPSERTLRRLHRALRRRARAGEVRGSLDGLARDLGVRGPGPLATGLRALAEAGALAATEPLPTAADAEEGGTRPPGAGSLEVAVSLRPWRGCDPARRRLTEAARARVDAVEAYARSRSCRRAVLLGWFGQQAPTRCDGCDRCLGPGASLARPGAGTRR